ncbi:Uncharacterised protein [Bordetella ansorpii]|uniref:Uncharacterized protein n=1 Tax=Bordetella ansorpii TaxID=288768 RepID=A0A157PKN8_9BORD|nr:hypothetical protein [Bordetella ansorpii]SAI33918.1 Uncharacterised protein [Bordetella ansorpii]
MRALIEKNLNQPALVNALVDFTGLMARVDFNLGQAAFVVAARGLRYGLPAAQKLARRTTRAAGRCGKRAE